MTLKLQRGFTLIEMLVVIAIISILIGIGVNTFTIAQKKARDVRRKADIRTIQTTFELAKQDKGSYAPCACTPSFTQSSVFGGAVGGESVIWESSFDDTNCGANSNAACSLKTWFTPTYIKDLPRDAVYGHPWNDYHVAFSANNYVISTVLENTSDPDMAAQTCDPRDTPISGLVTPPSRNYCVTNQQ